VALTVFQTRYDSRFCEIPITLFRSDRFVVWQDSGIVGDLDKLEYNRLQASRGNSLYHLNHYRKAEEEMLWQNLSESATWF